MSQINSIQPIFIVGAPRSGTSVGVWALGQHSNILPMEETVWIAEFVKSNVKVHESGSDRGIYSHLSNAQISLEEFMEATGVGIDQAVRLAFSRRLQAYMSKFDFPAWRKTPLADGSNPIQVSPDDPKQRWIDGTPLNSHYIWGLAATFPKAKFLHFLRKPEDVALSLVNFQNVGAKPRTIHNALKEWTSHTKACCQAEQALGSSRVKRFYFDDMKKDVGSFLAGILDFLDEPFDSNCLLPYRQILNSSKVQRDDPLMDKIVGNLQYAEARRLYEYMAQEMYFNSDDKKIASLKSAFIKSWSVSESKQSYIYHLFWKIFGKGT